MAKDCLREASIAERGTHNLVVAQPTRLRDAEPTMNLIPVTTTTTIELSFNRAYEGDAFC